MHLLLTTLRKAAGDLDPASRIDNGNGGDDMLGFAGFSINEDDADTERSRSHFFFHTVRVRDDRDKAGRGCRSHARRKCEVGTGARYAGIVCAERTDGAGGFEAVGEFTRSVSAIGFLLLAFFRPASDAIDHISKALAV